jgi:hypothetical protein
MAYDSISERKGRAENSRFLASDRDVELASGLNAPT